MGDSEAIFRAKYSSLRLTFESRLASLANTIRVSIEQMTNDQVLQELNFSTRGFRHHALSLIKRQLIAERDSHFHNLALKLADAEGEVNLWKKRNEKLVGSLELVRVNATLDERSRIKFTNVKTEIHDLRREYHVALEEADAECRLLKTELAESKRRSAVLAEERDEKAAHVHLQQASLTDARAKVLEANLRGTSVPRLERELGELKSINAKLSSDLVHTQGKFHEVAESYQRLKFQVQSLRNDLTQRERWLELAKANRKKSEAYFGDAIARMESLMEEDARENAAAIDELRGKALKAKDRLSAELGQIAGVNAQLTQSVTDAKVKCSELRNRIEVVQKSEKDGAVAAAAREEVLKAELEQERAMAGSMSQFLAEKILTHKLEDAIKHISQLRAMLRQEIGRREAAEIEVLEAQGFLNDSRQDLEDLRYLVSKLEQNERSSAVHEDEKNQKVEQLKGMGGGNEDYNNRRYREKEPKEVERGGQRQQAPQVPARTFGVLCSVSDGSSRRTKGVWPTGKDSEELRRAPQEPNRRRLISMGTHSREMLRALSCLRADLRGMKAQLNEAKAENYQIAKRFAEDVGSRAMHLTQALQRAGEEKAAMSKALAAGAKDRNVVARLKRVLQIVSAVLDDLLGVRVPYSLCGEGSVREDTEGVERFSSAVANALNRVERGVQRTIPRQIDMDSLKSRDRDLNQENNAVALDETVWDERSKGDFNMLAKLKKIEVESELESLRAEVDHLTEKYSKAVAERASPSVDNTLLKEVRKRANEEAFQVAEAHRGAVAALEAALEVEKNRCQDLRARLDRQTRDHQFALTESGQKKLQTQQDLDKVRKALEQTQIALSWKSARRARLDKMLSEVEECELISPRSTSPRSVKFEAPGRLPEEQDANSSVQN